MRKGMDAFAVLVQEQVALDPFEAALFVFTNKGRDKIKLLRWESNSFWVLYKKLLKQRFKWPKWFDGDHLSLSSEDLLGIEGARFPLDNRSNGGKPPFR